jgi:hypothetical protein
MSNDKITKISEDITSDFDGTVIDIETIGNFDKRYKFINDSREYQYIQQVIFGSINEQGLNIFCAKGTEVINELNQTTKELIDLLRRPLYAFNCNFERSVWFHQLGKMVDFDGELQRYRGETKRDARAELNIPSYGDPFNDNGYLCMKAWEAGDFDNSISHNRACLLKERDILIKRNFRKPDELKFIK